MTILRRNQVISFILAVSLVMGPFPASVFAAETYKPYGTLKKELTINGQKFYDIYDGAATGRVNMSKEFEFLFDVVNKKDLLKSWASLAYAIYKDNPDSYWDHSGKGFDKAFGNDHYMDLVDDFLIPKELSGSTSGNDDKFMSTGLTIANNLQEVETEMGKIIEKAVGRKLKGPDFVSHSPVDALHDTKEQTVLYTLAGGVDRSVAEYYYNCFGLVFYDFRLVPLIDADPYETAIGDKSMDEAIAQQDSIRDFSYQVESNGPSESSVTTQTNDSKADATLSYSSSEETSTTVSNTITNTNSYTYTESISAGVSFGKKFPGFKMDGHLDLGFEASQFMSTAYSDEKSITTKTSTQSTSTVTAPAHTAFAISSANSTGVTTVGYDCPVGVTYRVMIVSMNGKCYDDNALTHTFKTSGYKQKSFYTVFGNDNDASDAIDNLNERAINSKNLSGYETSRGNTKGTVYSDEKVSKTFATGLNWDSIFKQAWPTSRQYTESPQPTVNNLVSAKPMSVTGATMKQSAKITATTVQGIEPLYPLKIIKPTRERLRYSLNIGDTLRVNTIDMTALNKELVPYYGFNILRGKWKLVDENSNPLPETIATLKVDPLSPNTTLTAKGPGTGYIAYVIDEDAYSFYNSSTYTKNKDIDSQYIEFSVAAAPAKPFAGTVVASGEVTLLVGAEAVNISDIDTVIVEVYNETGKEIEAEVEWESRELPSKGIQVGNNTIRATKDGVFHIRAAYEGVYSDWIEVTALPNMKTGIKPADLTREDLALILYYIAGKQGITGYTGFDDVDLSETNLAVYKEAIAWASQNGIISGYKIDKFRAKELVTKEQFITIMYRYANYMGVDTSAGLDPDAIEKIKQHGVSPWAIKAVEWAISKGWITEADLEGLRGNITIDDFDAVPFPIDNELDSENDDIIQEATETQEDSEGTQEDNDEAADDSSSLADSENSSENDTPLE